MNALKSQVVTNLNTLVEGYSRILISLQDLNLSKEDQQLYEFKLLTIGYIMDILMSILKLSPKLNKLLIKTLSGERCTSAEADELNFRHVDHMRYVVNQLCSLLVNTILDTDDINQLLESNSITEVKKIYCRCKTKFERNGQLRSFLRLYQ